MTFLHSLALPENYKVALEGYLAVLDAVRREIWAASKKVRQLAEQDADWAKHRIHAVHGIDYPLESLNTVIILPL